MDSTNQRLAEDEAVLDKKASDIDVTNLEQSLLDKIADLLESLSEMFAAKEPTKKKQDTMQKNIKELYQML